VERGNVGRTELAFEKCYMVTGGIIRRQKGTWLQMGQNAMQMGLLSAIKHIWLFWEISSDLAKTDFFETFALTLCLPTIRIVLALAVIKNMELRSIDISYAFINSNIDVEIHMKQPEGFQQGGKNIVCKLNKSLYGLRQSPRLWSETLSKVLISMGFFKTYSDASLYIFDQDSIKVIVPVFVDDITLASKSVSKLDY
jgi:hypothetical protein